MIELKNDKIKDILHCLYVNLLIEVKRLDDEIIKQQAERKNKLETAYVLKEIYKTIRKGEENDNKNS